jgi:hypothetical protein
MTKRSIAACLALVLVAGPLSTLASAQQAPPPPSPQVQTSTSPPAPAEIRHERRVRRTDGYDVGAGVMTVLKVPFNVVLCGLGVVAGSVLFAATLGSAHRATAAVFEEGCGGPWVVRGDDIRPDDRTGGWYERESN